MEKPGDGHEDEHRHREDDRRELEKQRQAHMRQIEQIAKSAQIAADKAEQVHQPSWLLSMLGKFVRTAPSRGRMPAREISYPPDHT